ncbi:hypothetical protein E5E60_02995 [Helicobacter pylori]|nr:hypothetical protein E5E60_02995 [Helicobacter pylori]
MEEQKFKGEVMEEKRDGHEVIDIAQTISSIYRHEDRLDASDLAREEKKAVRAELQKSIDENLEALRKIKNSLFFTNLMRSTRSIFPLLSLSMQKMMEFFNNCNNKDGSR